MADPFCAQRPNGPQAVSAARVDHLPIVAHFARRLGLVEIINDLVRTEMAVEPAASTLLILPVRPMMTWSPWMVPLP